MVLKTMNDVAVGDVLKAPHGQNVEVVDVYDVHLPKNSFKVTNENNESIVVSGSHLWYVVTETDRGLHRKRMKEHKKILRKNLLPETIEYFSLLSKSTKDSETTVHEMMDMVGDNPDLVDVFERIAQSIGRVVEETLEFHEDGERIQEVLYVYNERLFAQQILGILNPKKYPYHVRIGRVINTYQMSLVFDEITIPDI